MAESGSSKKKRHSDGGEREMGSDDRRKLVKAEHQLSKLQSLLFEILSSLKNSADADSLTILADPLVNIEIAILRKRLQDKQGALDAASSSSSSSGRKGSRFGEVAGAGAGAGAGGANILPLHQELLQQQTHDKIVKALNERIKHLETENACLLKTAGDAAIQQYLWTIDQRNTRIAELHRDLSFARAEISELREHGEILSQQLFSIQAQGLAQLQGQGQHHHHHHQQQQQQHHHQQQQQQRQRQRQQQ